MKLAIVCASELTLTAFLTSHIRALAKEHDVTVFADIEDSALLRRCGISVDVIRVPISRKIDPWRDLGALLRLYRVLRSGHFDAVHSVTPKAGLIAMIASRLAGTKFRLHTFTGQVWASRSGLMRTLLKFADVATASLATHVLADSRSQVLFMVNQGVVREGAVTVLADGSISGVDTKRFQPNPAARSRTRAELGIAEGDLVFLYLGRINKDKGIPELCLAFSHLRRADAHLLVVGPDEEDLSHRYRTAPVNRLHFTGPTDMPEVFYAAADVFCLASHREGFGTSIIEAAATGLPAIGSRIYGLVDSIVDGETGLLFTMGSVEELAACMARFADNRDLVIRMGTQARLRAIARFAAPVLEQAMVRFYRELKAPC